MLLQSHVILCIARLLAMLLLLGLCKNIFAQTITIAEARTLPDETTIQVEGVIINTPNERSLRFIQDSTAGLAIYAPDAVFNQNVRIGDHIIIRGELDRFQGLIEISEIYEYDLISSNVSLPNAQGFDKNNLSSRVQLNCVLDEDYMSENNWQEGSYTLQWEDESLEGWIPENSTLSNTKKEAKILNAEGIVYEDDGGLHLLIQDISYGNDIKCLFWEEVPQLQNAGIDFFIFESSMSDRATLWAILHHENEESDTIQFNADSMHLSMIDELQAASMYQVEWMAFNSDDTLRIAPEWYITQSTSSKDIDVFFNFPLLREVDSEHDYFLRGIDMVNEIVGRIEGARETVDVCLYNFNNADIKAALEDAQDRGIRVRCLVEGDNSNIGFRNTDLTVYRMAYGFPLMHNKFIIVDANVADNAWLFMGATNLTPGQIFEDPNSALGIEDQMLSRIYEKEFEELWGSEDANFNKAESKQGSEKADNTPHQMFLQTIPVQSYFSPSDGTTNAIYQALSTAEDKIYFSLLTFTKNELRDILIELHRRGVEVKGIIENANDNGGEFYRLNNEGIEVLDDMKNRIHHHKYAIVDPGSEDAKLIFGSHNWTQKAEDTNDENTLIFQDRGLAQIFESEFHARWCELKPEDDLCDLDTTSNETDTSFLQLAPNPTESDLVQIYWSSSMETEFDIEIIDLSGKSVYRSQIVLQEGNNRLQSFPHLIPGIYLVSCKSADYEQLLRLMITE